MNNGMKILYSAVALALCAASASSSALELDQIKRGVIPAGIRA